MGWDSKEPMEDKVVEYAYGLCGDVALAISDAHPEVDFEAVEEYLFNELVAEDRLDDRIMELVERYLSNTESDVSREDESDLPVDVKDMDIDGYLRDIGFGD